VPCYSHTRSAVRTHTRIPYFSSSTHWVVTHLYRSFVCARHWLIRFAAHATFARGFTRTFTTDDMVAWRTLFGVWTGDRSTFHHLPACAGTIFLFPNLDVYSYVNAPPHLDMATFLPHDRFPYRAIDLATLWFDVPSTLMFCCYTRPHRCHCSCCVLSIQFSAIYHLQHASFRLFFIPPHACTIEFHLALTFHSVFHYIFFIHYMAFHLMPSAHFLLAIQWLILLRQTWALPTYTFSFRHYFHSAILCYLLCIILQIYFDPTRLGTPAFHLDHLIFLHHAIHTPCIPVSAVSIPLPRAFLKHSHFSLQQRLIRWWYRVWLCNKQHWGWTFLLPRIAFCALFRLPLLYDFICLL